MANYKNVANYKPSSAGNTTPAITTAFLNQTTTGTVFSAMYGDARTNTTESARTIIIKKGITITNLFANLETNSTTTDSAVAFRDDGADAPSLNIGQTSGEKDSGTISQIVVAGSDICISMTHGSNHELKGHIKVEYEAT